MRKQQTSPLKVMLWVILTISFKLKGLRVKLWTNILSREFDNSKHIEIAFVDYRVVQL